MLRHSRRNLDSHVMLEHFPATLALIGIVVLVSSLLSGWVERTGLPQVAIFLVLGLVLGPFGLGLLDLTLQSPALEVIATLALFLVLFSDAIGVDIGEARRNRRLALYVVGPGPCCRPCSLPPPLRSCSICRCPRRSSLVPRSRRPIPFSSARWCGGRSFPATPVSRSVSRAA